FWSHVVEGHRSVSGVPFDEEQLHLDYLHLLAANRVSVHRPTREALPVRTDDRGSPVIDWTLFEETTGKLLDGELFDDVPAATSFRFPMIVDHGDLLSVNDVRRLGSRYLAKKGWDTRAFYYLPDEPLRREYGQVIERSNEVGEFAPNIRRLVTEPYTPALDGHVEIWCPDIISMGDTLRVLPFFYKNGKLNADWQVNRRPSIYAERKAAGDEVWFYTCTSAQIAGYPNLFIDYGISYHRSIPWIAYRYGFTGILHWSTTYNYHFGTKDPWSGQFNYYANGDGNLLYPGTPELEGETGHFAVPSLRLIAFREGSEDYEYLSLLAAAAGELQSGEIAEGMVKSSLHWEKSALVYGQAKALISELLNGLEISPN
ncbi:MAG: DUF4091 domain-containing protein, partial [Spirochaetales bacterium]|nr:DUF4091 domain-containing protein [Spirochaetales bacterium]